MNSKIAYLIDDKYSFNDLVNFRQLQSIFNNFSIATGFAAELISFPDHEVLLQTENQCVCSAFQTDNLKEVFCCKECKLQILQQACNSQTLVIHKCKNGLMKAAIPVIVEGVYLANFLSDVVLFHKPDKDWFEQLARKHNCDAEQLFQAVKNVPILHRKAFEKAMVCLREMAENLAAQGLAEKRATFLATTLRESNEHLKVTLNSIGDGVILTDLKGYVQVLNPVAQKLTGWSQEEAIGCSIKDVFQIQEVGSGESVANPVYQVIETGKIIKLPSNTVLISKDGSFYQIADSAAPIKDSKDNVLGVVMVFRDETHVQQKQIQIEHNERFLNDLINSIQDGINVLDLDLNVVRMNSWMKNKYAPKLAVEGKKCYQIFQNRDTICPWCITIKAIETGETQNHTVPYPHERSPEQWLNVTAYPFKDRQGNVTGVIEYFRDITDQKKAEEEAHWRMAFQKLVSKISTRFIRAPYQETALEIKKALKEIGEFTGVDRVYVFQFRNNITRMDNTYEWVAKGIEPQKENLQDIDSSKPTWWMKEMRAQRPILIKSLNDILPESKLLYDDLKAQHIQSLLAVPMVAGKNLIGFMGFDSVKTTRYWTDDDQALITVVGETIAHTLERKRIQEALEYSELEHRIFLENFNGIAYHVVPLSFVPNFFYGTVEEITGYSSEDFLSEKVCWSDLLCEDDRKLIKENQLQMLEKPGLVTGMEYQIRDRKGNMHWIRDIAQVSTNVHNQKIQQGAIYDITISKESQKILQQSEENLKSFFNISIEFLWVFDSDGNILDVNDTVVKRLGWQKSELVGKPFVDVFLKECRKQAFKIIKQLLKHETEYCPISLQTKSGKEIQVETYTSKGIWNGDEVFFGVSKDVSALKMSEEKFSKLFNSIPAVVSLSDLETGEFVEVNQTFYDTFGYTPDEVIGKKSVDVVKIQKSDREQKVKQLKQGRAIRSEEMTFVKKSGEKIITLFSADLIHIQNKSYLLATSTDITARKKIEMQLAQSEQKFRVFFQGLRDFVFVIPFSKKEFLPVIEVNEIACLKYGYSKEEFSQLTLKDISYNIKNDNFDFIPPVEQFKENKIAIFEDIHLTKEGVKIPVEINSGIFEYNGQMVFLSLARDITQRKKNEARLIESEKRHRVLSNSTFEAIFFSEDGICIDQNLTAKKMFGYSNEEAIGRPGTDWVVPEFRAMVREKMAQENTKPYEVKALRKDGSTFWCEIQSQMYNYGGRKIRITALKDITDRKEAEKKHAALAAFVENYQDIIMVKDLERKIVATNMAFVKAVGKSSISEIIGKTVPEILNMSEDSEGVFEFVQDDIQTMKLPSGKVIIREAAVVFSDGKKRILLTRKFPICNDAGQVIQIGAISTDITEQYRLKKEQESSEAFLKHILKASAVGMLSCKARKIVWMNDVLLKMFNVSKPDQYIGKDTSIFFPSELVYQKNTVRVYERSDQLTLLEYDAQLCRVDGSVFDAMVKVNIIKSMPEEELIISIVDISDRKKAEKALVESEQKFRMLFENSPLGIFIAKPNGAVFNANKALLKMLGSPSLEATKAINLLSFQPVITIGYAEAFKKCLATGEVQKIEKTYTSKWGKTSYLTAYLIPLKDSESNIEFVYTIMEDLTERKQAEELLQRMQKLESVGTLAGGIAHDFNNLLMGIFGKIGLVKNQLPKHHSAQKQLEDAEKSMSRAKQLTKQLLTFAKGGDPVKEDLQIDEMIEEIARFDLSGSHVKPVFDKPRDLWHANVDKGQIQQVFSNLIINALQAMPKGGHLYINMQNLLVDEDNLQKLEPGNYLKLTFKDEGEGIEPRNMQYIFDPYYTTKKSGSGLGLATTYSIVHKHGGVIEVASELGKGTIFTLYLPAIISSNLEKNVEPESGVLSKEQLNILVMDDDEMILDVMENMLDALGHKVALSRDGKDAIEKYKKSLESGVPYDIVLMDLTIPGGMGGKQAIVELLGINPKVKVIVSSGYTSDSILSNYKEFGFKGFLEKPFTLDSLLLTIQRVISDDE